MDKPDVDETPDKKSDDDEQGSRWRWSRRATVWAAGALALIAATSAAGLVANENKPAPAAAADVHKNALDAILLKNPDLGKPIAELVRSGKLPKPTYAGDTGRIGVPKNLKHPSAPDGTIARYVPGSVKGDFNLLQLASLALSQGCSQSQAPIAAAIAAAESGGNPGAQGDTTLMDGTWDWSQGLWQIRGLRSERGTGGLRDSLANADPEKNASAMYTISSGCTNWTPWSTYTNGMYLSYLGLSKTAVLAAQNYESQMGSYPAYGAGAPVGVPADPTSTSAKPKPKPSSSGKSSTKPKPGTNKPKPHPSSSKAPNRPVAPPSSNAPKPPAPSKPAPTKSNGPLPLPSSLPVKLPTSSLPVKLPTSSLPVKLPTSSLPVKLPKPSLPKLPKPSGLPSLPLP